MRYESLQTPHKTVALARAQKIAAKVAATPPPPRPRLQELLQSFLDTCRAVHSHQHYRNTKARCEAIIRDLPARYPEDLTTPKLQKYLLSLAEKHRSSTVHGYRAAISLFCEHLITEGHLKQNPCRRIKLPRKEKLPPRFLEMPEVYAIYRVGIREGTVLLWYLALQTGLRSNELRHLRWEDIDLRRRMLTVRQSKSGRFRVVPISYRLAARLQAVRQPNGYVFPGERGGVMGEKQWKALINPLRKAIPKFTANHKGTGTGYHLLRHTAASWYVMRGGDIYRLSKMLGHASVTTTEVYAHLAIDTL